MGNLSIPLLGVVAQTAADVDDGSRGKGSEAQAAQPAAGERERDAVEVQVGDHVEWWLGEGHPTQQSHYLLRPTLKLGAGCSCTYTKGFHVVRCFSRTFRPTWAILSTSRPKESRHQAPCTRLWWLVVPRGRSAGSKWLTLVMCCLGTTRKWCSPAGEVSLKHTHRSSCHCGAHEPQVEKVEKAVLHLMHYHGRHLLCHNSAKHTPPAPEQPYTHNHSHTRGRRNHTGRCERVVANNLSNIIHNIFGFSFPGN